MIHVVVSIFFVKSAVSKAFVFDDAILNDDDVKCVSFVFPIVKIVRFRSLAFGWILCLEIWVVSCILYAITE